MNKFDEIFNDYEPRQSCYECKYSDMDRDECYIIECPDRCSGEEKICINDLECFYNQGRADGFREGLVETLGTIRTLLKSGQSTEEIILWIDSTCELLEENSENA